MERSASRQDASHRDAATTILFLALALGALWFVCCRHLSNEWSINEQYNYGWFVPFFAVYLFWLRWEDRPGREVRNAEPGVRNWPTTALIVATAMILLPVRVFEIANPDWRPLGWIHGIAAVAFTLTIIYLMGGTRWLRHFAFPVCFILTAVPWPSPVEEPIVQGLMRGIAAVAAETVSLFGVPAEVQGNLIHLSNGVVGVNEACSGVRSLQTSLMIGLLFGELKRLTVTKRVALVLAAIAVALLANFGRTLFLVAIAARQNIAAVGKWHDVAGSAIVVLVFAGTMWAAKKLESKKAKVENNLQSQSPIRSSNFSFPPSTFSFLLFFWFLAVELSAEGWYRIHEHSQLETAKWSARWPEHSPGFRNIEIDEDIRSALRFNEGREASWRAEASPGSIEIPTGKEARWYLFFFRWEPGTSTILRARAHRPDICLPSAGWKQTGDEGIRNYKANDALALPFRHLQFKRSVMGEQPLFADAFFCLTEDSVLQTPNDTSELSRGRPGNWAPPDRIRVVGEGLRNPGQQVMEFIIISPEPASSGSVEKIFADALPGLIDVRN
jgi:exosortase